MKKFLTLSALAMTSAMALTPVAANAQAVDISVNVAPPPLPVYAQPPIPGPGYIWVPGYWAWDTAVQNYYWVAGVWELAPSPGLLWTPPWWGWEDGAYLFHRGYWGPEVGFYGGIAYGFGYTGFGYQGAYWRGGHLFYNRTVNNISNVHITNVYDRSVTVNRVSRVSYNGGPGGLQARATEAQRTAAQQAHIGPTAAQEEHVQAARGDRQSFAGGDRGQPGAPADRFPGPHSQPMQPARDPGDARQDAADLTHAQEARPAAPEAARGFDERPVGAAPERMSFQDSAMRGAPDFGLRPMRVQASYGGIPHDGNGPHFGGGMPRFDGDGAPHFGGGAPHFGGEPHFGGGGGGHFGGGGGGHHR